AFRPKRKTAGSGHPEPTAALQINANYNYLLQHEQPAQAQLAPQPQLAPHGQLPHAAAAFATWAFVPVAMPPAAKTAASANEAINLTIIRKLLRFLGKK